MKEKKERPLKTLFSFAGEAKGRMTLSVIFAVMGELFGMAPFFAVAVLASQIYNGTATSPGRRRRNHRRVSRAMHGAACLTDAEIIPAQPRHFIYDPEEYQMCDCG